MKTQHNNLSHNNITHFVALDKSFLLSNYLSDKEHKVFIYLCRRANKESIAYPSMETIAKECNIKSKSTVSKIIKKLADLGLIKIFKLKKPIQNKYGKIMNVYEIIHPDYWKIKVEEEPKEDYIDPEKFDELIMHQIKILEAQHQLFDNSNSTENHERTESIENKGSNQKISKKCEHKEIINNNLTKEYGTLTEEKSSEKENKDKKPKNKDTKNRKSEAKDNINGKNKKTKTHLSRNSDFAYANYSAKNGKSFKLKEKSDFEKAISAKTRYKLYAYRQFYREYLNWNWRRLSKDQVLFFLINTEELVEDGVLSFDRVLKELWKADKDSFVKNPVGWLIDRFCIGNGRFYFLLSNRNKSLESASDTKNGEKETYDLKEREKSNGEKQIPIKETIYLLIKKYSIPEDKIFKPLPKGDEFTVNYILELRLVNYIWKNILSKYERADIISSAKKMLRKFNFNSPTEKQEILKDLIIGEVKDRYLNLSIEEKIRLRSMFLKSFD